MSAANPNPMEKSMVSVLVIANTGGGCRCCVCPIPLCEQINNCEVMYYKNQQCLYNIKVGVIELSQDQRLHCQPMCHRVGSY
jgi:hypothetical protein